jgi:hypothetical protein
MKAILQQLLFAHFPFLFLLFSLGCLARLRASVCVPVCSLCCLPWQWRFKRCFWRHCVVAYYFTV